MVHFQSWSKAFDRWVTKDLLMKQTEENKAHQLKLAQTLIKEKNPRNVLTKFYEFIQTCKNVNMKVFLNKIIYIG